eukprot:gene51716-70468_t
MNRFLETATPDTRDSVAGTLQQQHAALQETLDRLDARSAGRADLQQVQAQTDAITQRVDALWALHEQQTATADKIRQDLSVLVVNQKQLVAEASKMQIKIKLDEVQAKRILDEATLITTAADVVSDTVRKYTFKSTPEEKVAFAKERLAALIQQRGLLAS